uniref:Rheb2a n=1 Tax=Prokinetoplastina sp. TaxID=2152669 RepID=A0A2R4IKY3_9EUGL|nr:Rheb2a [Prokinetoplastina sp.]|eukprot:PhF_6_TR6266/c0_g1_i1/m.9482/K07208/RHEB; Ras homolog enriched in brain
MGNSISFKVCYSECESDRDHIDFTCMCCKERFGPNRRAFVCSVCKGGFCESCGITREGGSITCSPCIARQCTATMTPDRSPTSQVLATPQATANTATPKGIASITKEKVTNNDEQQGPPSNNGGVSPDRSIAIPQPKKSSQRALKHRKLCFLGHTSVGKSAIVTRYIDGKFSGYHNPTVSSVQYKGTTVDGESYNVSILDTAGQDEYTIFKPQWSIGTHGYALIYAVNDSASLEALSTIRNHLLECHAPDVPIVLVANKVDLPDGEIQISEAQGREMAAKWKTSFVQCSAKTGEGVNEVFEALLRRIAHN